jgi:DegV family protein with EDD domain
MAAAERFKKEFPSKKIFVLDSLSAASAMDLIICKIRDLILENKYTFDEITVRAEEIRRQTKCRFLLQDLNNLVKNGRMNKMIGMILSTANIKLVCGDDGAGEIKKYGMSMGTKSGLAQLASLPAKDVSVESPVFISHVHNPEDAGFLENILKTKFGFKNISVRLMRGLSSFYAADKGIILAY